MLHGSRDALFVSGKARHGGRDALFDEAVKENKPNRTNKGAVGTNKDTKIVTSLKLTTPIPRLSSFSQGFLFMTWSTFIPVLFIPFSDVAVCNDI